ncbi:hypothetical protein FN846DRAFT_903407 [Sphaerosporella brunnea]|uniref:Uncharacterized protein n=1 Tax=Sphaerosporella brunnea TaxID=1250544 RepID=A0A5J5F7N3_9PEZI|nr:hypothetical protein FN846DRAFT_903407 [Sphaerosporella brunnea]
MRNGLTQQPRIDDNLRWTTGRFEKRPPVKCFYGLTARLTGAWWTEWVEIPQCLDVTDNAPAEVHHDLGDNDDDRERGVSPSSEEDDEDEQLRDVSADAPAKVAGASTSPPADVLEHSDMCDDEGPQFVADSARAKAQSMIEYLSLEEMTVSPPATDPTKAVFSDVMRRGSRNSERDETTVFTP